MTEPNVPGDTTPSSNEELLRRIAALEEDVHLLTQICAAQQDTIEQHQRQLHASRAPQRPVEPTESS